MQTRALIMLVVALVLGGLAVYLVNNLLQRKVEERGEVRAVATRPVIVAAADLQVGTRLNADMLSTADWPTESIPKQAFSDIHAVLGDKAPVVLKEIRQGEAVLPYKVSPHGARGGLTVRVPAGMRAITIPVNEVKGVAGFVLPGDKVDVLHTAAAGGARQQETRLLLQNVLVLGVDQTTSESEDDPKVVNAVTLLVTPEQGKKLTLARSVGDISLLLRNEADTADAEPSAVSVSDLRFTPAPQPEPDAAEPTKQREPGLSVEVIRGLSVQRQGVPE